MDPSTSYFPKQNPSTYCERLQTAAVAGVLALVAQLATAQSLPVDTLQSAKFATNFPLASVSGNCDNEQHVIVLDEEIGNLAISLAGRQTGLQPEIAKVLADHLSELFD